MTATVLARPAEGRQRAGQPKPRGPVVPARRAPGPAGRIVRLDKRASVQFLVNPCWFRIIAATPAATVDGWVWLDGYELDEHKTVAVAKRTVFVRDRVLSLSSPPQRSVADGEQHPACGVADPSDRLSASPRQ